jgi:hypothetical protein
MFPPLSDNMQNELGEAKYMLETHFETGKHIGTFDNKKNQRKNLMQVYV